MRAYINPVNLPPQIKVLPLIVWWMFLDYIKAPGWAKVVIFGTLAILYAWDLYKIIRWESVDLFTLMYGDVDPPADPQQGQ